MIPPSDRERIDRFISSFEINRPPSSTSAWKNNVDFIVSTGDNFYEDGIHDEFDAKTRRNFENVYDDPSIQDKVFFICKGNHCAGAHGVFRDISGLVRYTLQNPRQRFWFPATYYAHEFVSKYDPANSVFIAVLDTYDVSPHMTQMTKAQIEWLRWRLSRTRARWRFVVGHRPLLSAGKKHGSSKYMQNLLYPIFDAYNVSAYFCGDDHQIQVVKQPPLSTSTSTNTSTATTTSSSRKSKNGTNTDNKKSAVIHVVSGAGSRLEPIKHEGIPGATLYQRKQYGFVSIDVVSKDLVRLAVHHTKNEEAGQEQEHERDDDKENEHASSSSSSSLASFVYEIKADT